MDFSTIAASLSDTTGVPVHIKAPDGSPLFAYEDAGTWHLTTAPEQVKNASPVRFYVVGADSAPFRRAMAELYKATKKAGSLAFNEAEEQGAKSIAAAVVGWENVIWEGAQMEFTPQNVVKFLTEYKPAAEQIDAFVADRANFFKVA